VAAARTTLCPARYEAVAGPSDSLNARFHAVRSAPAVAMAMSTWIATMSPNTGSEWPAGRKAASNSADASTGTHTASTGLLP